MDNLPDGSRPDFASRYMPLLLNFLAALQNPFSLSSAKVKDEMLAVWADVYPSIPLELEVSNKVHQVVSTIASLPANN